MQRSSALDQIKTSLRLDIVQCPCNTSMLPVEHLQCASLVGHLTQPELDLALEEAHGDLPDEELRGTLRNVFKAAQWQLPLGSDNETFLLTFKLYHSKQAGFSPRELDALGFFFRFVPSCFSAWVKANMDAADVSIICSPTWQLIAPDNSSLNAFWMMSNRNEVDLVTDVASLGIV